MELIRGLHNIRPEHRACVLSIGKFDGVHLGHQQVLQALIEQARLHNLPSAVMVFEPQPEEVFNPAQAPARLSRWRDKYNELKKLGIDRLICVHFNDKFAQQSAQSFVQDCLVNALGVKFLAVGDDFCFGQGRRGNFAMLSELGASYGFSVHSTQSFRLDDHRISSTAIRRALAASQFSLAEEMLGQPFAIEGKVVHGQKKGRTIGFPTANINLKRLRAPLSGVFAVCVQHRQTSYYGVANIGARPTVDGESALLEVHLFCPPINLYGERLVVCPKEKLREVQKFANLSQLQQQIMQDVTHARDYFTSQGIELND